MIHRGSAPTTPHGEDILTYNNLKIGKLILLCP